MKIFAKLFCFCLPAILLLSLSNPVFSVELIVPDTGQTLCYDLNYDIIDLSKP